MLYKNKSLTLNSYLPLVIITLFSFVLSVTLMQNQKELLYRFMGFFLSLFSLFKWLDIKGFMEAFKEYDLISKYFPPYLIVYPIVELVLGLCYISLTFTLIANMTTIILMSLNAISIIKALWQRKKLSCACLGSLLKLPLSYVSLFEIAAMMVMAFYMLYS